MDSHLELFKHIYIDNKAPKTLFLLHGTGGDEHDLLPLVSELNSKYNFVGLRGNIDENGMRRFFRRFDFGKFDEQNIIEEALKLVKFIETWSKEYTI